MTPEPPIRVLIVDDQEVVRAGIAALLGGCEDITVVAATGSLADALGLCGERGVDVVLMDLSMPEMDSATTTARLLEHCPDVRVVLLTNLTADDSVRAAIQAGASACLLKTVGKDELTDAIRGVTQGRSTFSSDLLPFLVGPAPEGNLGINLTAREREILALLADGHTNRGIARALDLAEGTVRVYVSTILGKLGATNRTEATVLAIREGLVEPPKGSPQGH